MQVVLVDQVLDVTLHERRVHLEKVSQLFLNLHGSEDVTQVRGGEGDGGVQACTDRTAFEKMEMQGTVYLQRVVSSTFSALLNVDRM